MKKILSFIALLMALISLAFGAEKTDIKTLLIASHPYPESSTFIKALEEAARSVEGVEVRNLEQIYGFDTRAIDGAKEYEITKKYDRIVFLFPTHWFNITPMMKAYLNETWGSVGPGLWKGKQMLVVSTAGGGRSTYGKNGRIGVELKNVFLPMKASALHCEMTYLEPLVFEGVSYSRIEEYKKALIERLKR
ncbi:flavodoxin family protein [Campylobacter sp. MIT 99-7217]|uniref:NAD(P)H-dependent oxidoreductase n=1 Tax=Campylobacter sp. MIT 99-7217 TaxID=535091 RepID=UPI001158F419|nr:NAD(P)H-dependent oxidoreductase [Campylobacter sp. MIT 99-7217]TQR34469.1 flavodoxin family protein [Campylobacter sp. MIT 99-7217]